MTILTNLDGYVQAVDRGGLGTSGDSWITEISANCILTGRSLHFLIPIKLLVKKLKNPHTCILIREGRGEFNHSLTSDRMVHYLLTLVNI